MPKLSQERAYGSRTAKYHNQRTCVDGIRFDSQKEARRYQELKLLERKTQLTARKKRHEVSLAERCADLVCYWRSRRDVYNAAYDAIDDLSDELAEQPEVARVLEQKENAKT